MANKTTISVAMCTYNGETFLKEQLESISAQTVHPSELIICDDRSIDYTLEILYSFRDSCNFPVKIIVNSETLWVTKNFENAIAHCTGEIIVLADQDDIWQPYKLEKIIKSFQDNPNCGYVFSNADLIDGDGMPLKVDLWRSIGFNEIRVEKYGRGDQLEVMLRGANFIYGMTLAFRSVFSPCLLPIQTRSANCAHDTWIPLMLSARGYHGVAIPELLVKYRQHEKQVVGAYRPFLLKNYLMGIWTNSSEGNLALATALESIATRLQCARQNGKHELHAIKQLTDKAEHLRSRFLANSLRGFQKIKIVFREMISGRYGRFSGSYKSAIKDLIASSTKSHNE